MSNKQTNKPVSPLKPYRLYNPKGKQVANSGLFGTGENARPFAGTHEGPGIEALFVTPSGHTWNAGVHFSASLIPVDIGYTTPTIPIGKDVEKTHVTPSETQSTMRHFNEGNDTVGYFATVPKNSLQISAGAGARAVPSDEKYTPSPMPNTSATRTHINTTNNPVFDNEDYTHSYYGFLETQYTHQFDGNNSMSATVGVTTNTASQWLTSPEMLTPIDGYVYGGLDFDFNTGRLLSTANGEPIQKRRDGKHANINATYFHPVDGSSDNGFIIGTQFTSNNGPVGGSVDIGYDVLNKMPSLGFTSYMIINRRKK